MLRHVPLVIIVLALLVAAAIPAINSPSLWFGIPPLIVWSVVGVALLTPALALVEFGRRSRDRDDDEEVSR